MNAATWQLVKQIFDEARDLVPPERPAFLDRKCVGNAELRGEVEKLLGSYDSGFLEETALEAAEALVKPSIEAGRIIGRYRIGEIIGSGGMGQVFLAEDTELGRPVAFKVLHHDVGADDERLRRFVQEARAASALNHPNILTIHEIGSFEGFRFIVSEYVDGKTLRDRMRRGLNTEESVDITCQIAAALKAAHSAGIVHRDIKPENIMLRDDGLVKVLDFGLAKLTEADDKPIDPTAPVGSRLQTSPGLVMGTAAYMSPEQARGQAVDARSDLWSLGVVLHEMLTGSSPFEGETVSQLINSILKAGVSNALSENVPPELQPICRKALANDKDSRYRSAHDLLKDLEGEKKRMDYATHQTPYVTVSSGDELKTQLIRPRPTISAEYIVTSVKRHKYATLLTATLVMITCIGLSVYTFNGATPVDPNQSSALIDSATTEKDLKFSRVPISGRTNEAVISPDGKYVAYSDRKGINLLNLEARTESVMFDFPPADGIWNLKFSPDSRFVYYVYSVNADPSSERIMRVSVPGGTPTIVIPEVPVDGFGFATDNSVMAFSRERADGAELVLAKPDGSNQRVLTKMSSNSGISNSPVFSPDGRTVACHVWFTEAAAKYFKIVGFPLEGGEQRIISDKQWANIFGGVWLPNGNMIVSAIEKGAETQSPPQLWLITPDGHAKAITSGLLGYQALSATRDGSIILSHQIKSQNDIWLLPNNDSSRAKAVTTSGEVRAGFSATPDGRIVMGSNVTGNIDLWILNPDGGGRKQLTTEGGVNSGPIVSPDNKNIVFSSDRGDRQPRLYRMDIDGQNVRRLTEDGGASARFDRVGKWVYYLQSKNGKRTTLRKVSINGGESVMVATAPEGWELNGLDVNRSDDRVACGLTRKPNGPREYKVGVIPANSKAKWRIINLPSGLGSGSVRWMPDGRSLATLGTGAAVEVWRIPIDGKTKPGKITDFKTPTTNNFNWSVDGKFMLASRGSRTSEPVMIRNTEQ